jgi:hypothetical protein
MSRRRRDQYEKADDMFMMDEEAEAQEPQPTEQARPSFQEVDARGYGEGKGGPLLDKLDAKIVRLPINNITPDPIQPRRTIPNVIREQWDGDPQNIFPLWEQLIRENGHQGFSLAALLKDAKNGAEASPEGDLRREQPNPIEAELLKVIDLAVSIQRDGLTNPITVVPKEIEGYYLETGERRWLAHHLLLYVTNDSRWGKIDARKQKAFSVWRQAGENNARDNLNAIGKARQFALLIMDLHRDKTEFAPLSAFMHEQDFYAQVADASDHPVPRGKGDELAAAMGVSNRAVTTRYRKLLTLPRAVWLAADDLGWPERRLRKLEGLPDHIAIAKAARWAQDEGYVLPMGNITPEEKPDLQPVDRLYASLIRAENRLEKQFQKVDRTEALELLRQHKRWINELEKSLK